MWVAFLTEINRWKWMLKGSVQFPLWSRMFCQTIIIIKGCRSSWFLIDWNTAKLDIDGILTAGVNQIFLFVLPFFDFTYSNKLLLLLYSVLWKRRRRKHEWKKLSQQVIFQVIQLKFGWPNKKFVHWRNRRQQMTKQQDKRVSEWTARSRHRPSRTRCT